MKTYKVLSVFIVVYLILSVMIGNAYASTMNENSVTYTLSDEDLAKMREVGVAEEDISSLLQQIEVYNLSAVQVENYIKGLINRVSEIWSYAPIDYEKTENGDLITPDGVIPYINPALQWESSPITRGSSTISDGACEQITVTIPTFPVTLNEQKYESNDYEQYPFLLYRDITYFPMTYYQSNLLNLRTTWTEQDGLMITKDNPDVPKSFSRESPISNRNSRTQIASIVDEKVTVNGKNIDNRDEQYPILLFRDIVYLPLTWRFAVDEFGWDYTYNDTTGLNIRG